jgi:hypothetical protein
MFVSVHFVAIGEKQVTKLVNESTKVDFLSNFTLGTAITLLVFFFSVDL